MKGGGETGESKLLRTNGNKASPAIEDISVAGKVVKVRMANGALCDAKEVLNSKYFKENGLSVISFALPESGCEFSVERISDRLFNYVVTKGVIAFSAIQESEGIGTRPVCRGSVIIGADGTVNVADVGEMRDNFDRDDQDILIEGRSLRRILHYFNTGWKRVVEEETGHVAYRTSIRDYPSCIISDIRVASQEECYANKGGDSYLEEIKSLSSDDELAEELRSIFYGALSACKEGEHDIYEEKLAQHHASEMIYLGKLDVDRDDDQARSVLSPLLCGSEVADAAAQVVPETDVVGSESPEVCAEIHAEAANDEDVIDVDTAEGQCAGNILKVRSVLNLLIDSYGNIVENADKGGVDRNNDDQVSSVLDQVSDSGKVVDTVSVRSV